MEKKLKASQSVLPVTDETDLDAAAKFDIHNWVKYSGLPEVDADVPQQFVSQELEKTYTVPKVKDLTSMGVLTIDLSSLVKEMDIEAALGLQSVTSDGNGGSEIKAE